uniref:Uncharacterized protein n=1 Tax=Arundo donax TaxID=35708 RepID=A0A0A9ES73_ARUDO
MHLLDISTAILCRRDRYGRWRWETIDWFDHGGRSTVHLNFAFWRIPLNGHQIRLGPCGRWLRNGDKLNLALILSGSVRMAIAE